ncbi:hypothetical protein D3C72_1879240 [compost metagenome]
MAVKIALTEGQLRANQPANERRRGANGNALMAAILDVYTELFTPPAKLNRILPTRLVVQIHDRYSRCF